MANIKIRRILDKFEASHYSFSSTEGFCGNFGTKYNPFGFGLIELDACDMEWLDTENVKLKEHEACFRITTDNMKIAGLQPMIKISYKTGMAYFLTDNANDMDIPEFEPRGVKILFLNILVHTQLYKLFVN